MKLSKQLLPSALFMALALAGYAQEKRNSHYITNQAPSSVPTVHSLTVGSHKA